MRKAFFTGVRAEIRVGYVSDRNASEMGNASFADGLKRPSHTNRERSDRHRLGGGRWCRPWKSGTERDSLRHPMQAWRSGLHRLCQPGRCPGATIHTDGAVCSRRSLTSATPTTPLYRARLDTGRGSRRRDGRTSFGVLAPQTLDRRNLAPHLIRRPRLRVRHVSDFILEWVHLGAKSALPRGMSVRPPHALIP